jgi:hypothetical protein
MVIRRGTDDKANEDSALIWNWNKHWGDSHRDVGREAE